MNDPYKLKKHEGLRLKPYRCPAGRLTIGYGRNLENNGITEREAEVLLAADIRRAEADLRAVLRMEYGDLKTQGGPAAFRWSALVNMAFNLGRTRLSGFRNMIAAVRAGDWAVAAAEALDSRWSRQVGKRADDIAHTLRTGWWPGEGPT